MEMIGGIDVLAVGGARASFARPVAAVKPWICANAGSSSVLEVKRRCRRARAARDARA
jgi:hypothetical protein